MNRWAGRTTSRQLMLILLIVGIMGGATAVNSQPAETFRLDVSVALLSSPHSTGFLGGVFAPTTGAGRTELVALFDVSGTVNVTEHLSVAFGMPFGLVEHAASPLAEEETTVGLGDVHAEVGYQLVGEGRVFPGVRVQLEGGAPTADSLLLGADLWRATGRLALSKTLSPRVGLFATTSASNFFDRHGVEQAPIVSYGGGIGLGITRTLFLTLQLEQVAGGERTDHGTVVVPSTEDLRAGIGATVFSRGRPRLSLMFGAGRIQDDPTFLFTLNVAVLSL